MAITIDRTGITLTNDTGTPASPNGDGTLLNAADRVALLDRIDELFNGTRSATFSFGTLLSVDGFGVSNFSAGGTGGNVVAVRNTTSGTGNYGEVRIGNNSTDAIGRLKALSSAFTTSSYDFASGFTVQATGGGGLNLAASDASGPFRIYTGGTTQRYAIDSSGVHTYLNSTVTSIPMADGSSGSPSITFQADSNTGFYRTGSGDVSFASDGTQVVRFAGASGATFGFLGLQSGAWGTGARQGSQVSIGRNSSGSGAAGTLSMGQRGGTARVLWVDNSGNLLIHTAAPTEDNTTVSDTAGTVVGTQTSLRATKRNISAYVEDDAALHLILDTPLYRFQYCDGDPDNHHVGIMADESPAFTRYRGTAFDPVNGFGYSAAAIKALARRVLTLEAALAARG